MAITKCKREGHDYIPMPVEVSGVVDETWTGVIGRRFSIDICIKCGRVTGDAVRMDRDSIHYHVTLSDGNSILIDGLPRSKQAADRERRKAQQSHDECLLTTPCNFALCRPDTAPVPDHYHVSDEKGNLAWAAPRKRLTAIRERNQYNKDNTGRPEHFVIECNGAHCSWERAIYAPARDNLVIVP